MAKKRGLLVRAAVLWAAVCAGGPSSPLLAGPCYDCPGGGGLRLSHDRVLPGLPAGGQASDPDVAVSADRAFVVFVDDSTTPSNPAGLAQVWIAWSAGFGCAWNGPVALTADPATPSLAPAIAVAGDCLDVVYARGDRIYHRHASLATFPVLGFDAEEALSSPLASPLAANPDLASVATGSGVHVYAVWEASPASGPRHVMFRRNLSCGQGGSWTGSDGGSDESDLTNLGGAPDFGASNSLLPAVQADAFGLPGASAVTVAFLNDNGLDNPPPTGDQGLYLLRSVDSGQSFFGDPPAASPAPRKVDDDVGVGTHPAASRVALASSGASGNGGSNWSFLAWSDQRQGSNRDIYVDGRLEDASQVQVPFTSPDVPAENGTGTASEPAASATMLTGSSSAEAFSYHVQSRSGHPEINARRWSLGTGATAIVPACSIGGASILQLTGLHPTARVAGRAASPAVAAGLFAATPEVAVQFLAWVDSRSGSDEIWWKTTDPIAPGPATGLAIAPTACPISGLDLSWTPPADCDIAEWSLAWDDGVTTRSIVLPAFASSHQIAGLAPDTSYSVTLQAYDEACNPGIPTILAGRSPVCAAPVLKEAPPRAPDDQCNTSPAPGHRDGQVEPNEIVQQLFLPVNNDGAAAATAVTGSLAPNPWLVLGSASASWPDIPPGAAGVANATPFSFQVRATTPCGTDLDLRLDLRAAEFPWGMPLDYRFRIPGSGAGCDVCGVNAHAIAQPPTFSDVCTGTGVGAGNGFPDPGEELRSLRLPLRNAGTTAVTNLNVVSLSSPTPGVSVIQGLSTYGDIAPGATELNQIDFAIALDRSGFSCSGINPPLRLELTVIHDQTIQPVTLGFSIATPDPASCGECLPPPCQALPPPLPAVLAARRAGDVELSWTSVAEATRYNVYAVIDGRRSMLPQANETTAGSDPGVVLVCAAVADPVNACNDPAAVSARPALVYYQVRGVCRDGQEGNAHPY